MSNAVSPNVAENQMAFWRSLKEYCLPRFCHAITISIFTVMAVLVICLIGWAIIGFFYPTFFEEIIIAKALSSISLKVAQPLNVTNDTLYMATLEFYTQLIAILIFIISIAGVLAFVNILRVSKERVDEVATKCTHEKINSHFNSHEVTLKIQQLVEQKFDDSYGMGLEEFQQWMEHIGPEIEGIRTRQERFTSKIEDIEDMLQRVYDAQGWVSEEDVGNMGDLSNGDTMERTSQ